MKTNKASKELKEEEKLSAARVEAISLIDSASNTAKEIIELARVKALEATHAANGLIETAKLEAVKLMGTARDQTHVQGLQARYVDLSRIPLICQSILDIKKMLEEMKEKMVLQIEFRPIKAVIYGVIGMILTGALGSILTLILRK